MSRKSFLAVLLALALGATLGSGRAAANNLHVSSDLLLPSFEVDLKGGPMTTLWSVTNSLDQPIQAVATVYTDWGIPVLEVPLTFAPRQVLTFNLRDWLLSGQLPDGPLNAAQLAELQATLSGQLAPREGLFFSTVLPPGRALGYIVVRVQGTERPAALFGDFFVLGPSPTAAAGDILVDVSPSTSCPELCPRHALRFLSGTAFDYSTQLILWTASNGQPSATADDPAEKVLTLRAKLYDEGGRLMGQRQLLLPPMAVVRMSELTPSGPFGWVDLDLGTNSWVGVRYSSRNGDSVAFATTCLPPQGSPAQQLPSSVPGLSIRKITNGIHSAAPPGPTVGVGSTVSWSYVIRNTGQVPLTEVQVSDDQGVAVQCPKTALAPREEMVCTGQATAVVCQYTNVGTVLATPPQGPVLEAQDAAYYYGDPAPGITLVLATNGQRSTAPPGIGIAVGSPVSWTYQVTNTGRSTLSGVVVTDDQGVAVSCPRGSLAPGATMTCTASGTAVAGQYANVGRVTAQPPCGAAVSTHDGSWYYGQSPPPPAPGIAIQKYTNGQHVTSAPGLRLPAGSTVTWTYTVTNTGSSTLSNVQVTDNRGVGVLCPKTTLAPGESMTCTGSGTATAGQYSNTGTATGTSPSGATATAHDDSWYYGQSTPPPSQGCTPGYWKNHPAAWPATGYSTDQSVASVFQEATLYGSLGSASLLSALSFQGGPDLDGAAQILLRAGVAALLNASDPELDYPRQAQAVIADVNSALASGDRDTMLNLAGQLDTDNNLSCPLS